ncbi:MAG: hypothetical protein UU21_C0004G0034 [Candidatus Levybacteria bacterium GW2011_GWA2_40_8]|nr:MAG: hypothetical protein UU21_C0004G0034 [Candidatus Levybacteria bacterium GW2011_GWA2_40_8]
MKPRANIFRNIKIDRYVQMLPDFKEERTQQITTLALTLLALSFFGIFAINPTLSTITRLKKELEDNKYVDSQLQTKINNISLLQQSYTGIEDELFYATDAIPVNSEAPLLAAQIQALAERSSVSIANLQVFEIEITKKTQGKNQYSAFSFNVAAKGERQKLLEFMSDLGNIQRVVTLDVLSLSSLDSGSQSFQLNIQGSAFFKNQ